MNLRQLILPISVTALLAATAVTVFRFYKEEKPFYIRLKKRKKVPYKLRNARITADTLVAHVTQGKLNFVFSLSFLNDEIIHIQINDPIYPRYVVQDVVKLPSTLKMEDLTMRHERNYLHVSYHNFNIKINCDDLEIYVYKNNDLFLSINAEKFFVMEEQEPYVGIAADFLFLNAFKTYGLPQHAERLSLQANGNKLYRLYNTDRFAYSATHPHESLYGAVPLIYAYGTNQTTGLLWLNSSETIIDICSKDKGLRSTFFSESGAVDFYILNGPKLQDVVRQNSQLTGILTNC